MKKACTLLIAFLLLAGMPFSAMAENIGEPAVILPETHEEAAEEENSTESATSPAIKTENNYNRKVLLDDENCQVSVADASLSEEGWILTVQCENRREEALVFSWENTAEMDGKEISVWNDEIRVAPESHAQMTFCTSEVSEADILRLGVTVSEPEADEEAAVEAETAEEEKKDSPEEPAESEEPYFAEATALMKNVNGFTCVLDDAASPIVVDFEALKERNGDVCAWLYCPDTVISYPVVEAEDNSFYLHRDIDLNYSSYGTLFTEAMSARNFDNDNSIIYGHHMKDGGMFAGLVNYAKESYYIKHPVFYLNTPEMNYRVEVFAAFLTDMYSDAYNNSFDSDEEMQAWLDAAKELSAIETEVEVQPGDRILTLSTCTYEYDTARYVVMGKMIPIP